MKFLAALTLVLLVGSAWSQDPVKVTVDYESECPDSRAFISTQLWPVYQLIPDLFVTTFIPYGKANFTANGASYDFVCQHGAEECYGNKIHSCALYYYPDGDDDMNFIGCSMSARDPVVAAQGCAEQYKLNWTLLYDCANSDFGSQLLEKNGEITQGLNPPLSYVPWIIINDVYSDANEQAAQQNFLALICSTYTGTLPPVCEGA